jgi:hypothetical protein
MEHERLEYKIVMADGPDSEILARAGHLNRTLMQRRSTIGPIREMRWESLTNENQSVANPSWSDVEAQRHLEIAKSGSVFLNAANGSSLAVVGMKVRATSSTLRTPTGFALSKRLIPNPRGA